MSTRFLLCLAALLLSSLCASHAQLSWNYVGPAALSTGTTSSLGISINTFGTCSPCVIYTDANKPYVKRAINGTLVDIGTTPLFQGVSTYVAITSSDTTGVIFVAAADTNVTNKLTVLTYSDAAGTGWQVVGTRGISAGTPTWIDLAISPAGVLYVAYGDSTLSSRAVVQKYDTGSQTWSVQGSSGFTASGIAYSQLGFTSASALYLSGKVGSNPYVYTFNGAAWSALGGAAVDAGNVDGTSMVISQTDGKIYVAYESSALSYQIVVKAWNGAAWSQVGTAFGYNCFSTRMAMSPDGTLYVAATTGNVSPQKGTVFTYDQTNTWVTLGGAAATASNANPIRFAFDSYKMPYIIYKNGGLSSKASLSAYVCPAGYIPDSTGGGVLPGCSPCVVGLYNPLAGAKSCLSCPMGTYADVQASTACSPCLAGTYSTSVAATSSAVCQLCPAGAISANASSSCTDCAQGSYASAAGSSSCKLCSAGSFSNINGATNCTSCAAGYYSGNGSTSCTACMAGKYSAAGASSCLVCPAGSYNTNNASSNCTLCDAGYYSNTTGSTSCNTCAAGLCSETGSTNCTVCPVSNTTVCPAGTFSNTTASGVCYDCPVGFANPSSNQTSCTACSLGYFANVSRSTSCSSCPAGMFGNSSMAHRCFDCEAGTVSSSASSSCSVCPPNTFSLLRQSSCSACSAGVMSLERSPLCNIYNASAVASGSNSSSLAPNQWKCFRELAAGQIMNSSLLVYLQYSNVSDQQALKGYVSCFADTYSSLPMGASTGTALTTVSTTGDVNVPAIVSQGNAFLSDNRVCSACLQNTGSTTITMGVTISRLRPVVESGSAVMDDLPANIPWYLLVDIAAKNNISNAAGKSVSVNVNVVGGTVDVYVSLENPTPSVADHWRKYTVSSTTLKFSVQLSVLQNSVFLSIVNPVAATLAARSGTGPQVSVSWSMAGPTPDPNPTPSTGKSSSSGLTDGEIAAIVILLLFAIVCGAVCYWYLFMRRRRLDQTKEFSNDQELAKDQSVIAVETLQQPQQEVLPVSAPEPIVAEAPVVPTPAADEPQVEVEMVAEEAPQAVAQPLPEEESLAGEADEANVEAEPQTVQVSIEDVAGMDSEAAIAVLRNMTPVLGVVAQDVKSGVMIKVVPSNMADAGLKKGDVITGIDGIVIRNRKELRDIVRSHVVGDMLTVDVSRGSGGPSISLPWVIQAAGSSPELINALRQRKVGSSN